VRAANPWTAALSNHSWADWGILRNPAPGLPLILPVVVEMLGPGGSRLAGWSAASMAVVELKLKLRAEVGWCLMLDVCCCWQLTQPPPHLARSRRAFFVPYHPDPVFGRCSVISGRTITSYSLAPTSRTLDTDKDFGQRVCVVFSRRFLKRKKDNEERETRMGREGQRKTERF
jgi:hypothetical protein